MKYKLRDNFSTDPWLCMQDILQNRGVKDIENFTHPSSACELDPYTLDNIDMAAKTLLFHLENNSKILTIVDCDTDGYMSSSILWLYIKDIYPNAHLNFTVHEHKQHGLEDKIHWILEQDFNLVICPDAASFDISYHKQLHEAGIECICLDHHSCPQDEQGNDILPNEEYAIVVNNQICNYKNKSLCGAGIVYKFCEMLDSLLHIHKAQHYLDLVALGEIADVMDKTDIETNYIITEGLRHIQNEGFKTLIEAQSFSLKEKAIAPYNGLTSIDIAFYIAPLINAITRVGSMTEKENLFYCFIEPYRLVPSTKRGAKSGDTELAAEQIARVGKNAKARQDKIKEKAMDLIDFKIQKDDLLNNNILVIELNPSDDIPQEMSGLVAMGAVSKYNKPCLIVRRNADGLLQGSARNNSNFSALPNLKEYLEKSGFFEYAAGHANAFGGGIKASRLSNFIAFINADLPKDAFENCYTVDYILDAVADNVDLLEALASHPEYFGNHIDEVTLIIKNIPLSNIMVMGGNKDCMKISYNGIDYVRFKDTSFINDIMDNRTKTLTIYAKPNLNTFNGKTSIQCFINDYEFTDNNNHKYDF